MAVFRGDSVTEGENGGGGVGGAFDAEEGGPNAFASAVLVAEEAEENASAFEGAHKFAQASAALEEHAAGSVAEFFHEAVEGRLVEAAVGGGGFVAGKAAGQEGVEFEVSKVANGDNAVPGGSAIGALAGEWLVRADEGAARGGWRVFRGQ